MTSSHTSATYSFTGTCSGWGAVTFQRLFIRKAHDEADGIALVPVGKGFTRRQVHDAVDLAGKSPEAADELFPSPPVCFGVSS